MGRGGIFSNGIMKDEAVRITSAAQLLSKVEVVNNERNEEWRISLKAQRNPELFFFKYELHGMESYFNPF